MASALNEAGYSALAFDFAGCGHSDDDTLHPDKLLDDLQSAIRFAQLHDFESIALYGHSLGTTISLRAYSSAIQTMVLSGAGTGAIDYDWTEFYSREQLHELSTTGLLTTTAGGEVQRSVVIQAALLDSFESIDARTLLSPVKCPVLLVRRTLSQTMAAKLRGTGCRSLTIQPAGVEVGAAPAPLSRGLMVDAVLYACTSPSVPNGAYLRGRRVHPLPRAAAGAAAQQRMWRATCRTLALDVRTGWPMRPPDLLDQPVASRDG